jgi:hypothetical protein
MRLRCSGDKCIGGVNCGAATSELRLVPAGPNRRLPRRLQKTQPTKQSLGHFPLPRPDAALDLSKIDAARAERVMLCHEIDQKACHVLVAAHVGDQHRRVKQVETQSWDSVPRVLRTQDAAASRSRQWEYALP